MLALLDINIFLNYVINQPRPILRRTTSGTHSSDGVLSKRKISVMAKFESLSLIKSSSTTSTTASPQKVSLQKFQLQ